MKRRDLNSANSVLCVFHAKSRKVYPKRVPMKSKFVWFNEVRYPIVPAFAALMCEDGVISRCIVFIEGKGAVSPENLRGNGEAK